MILEGRTPKVEGLRHVFREYDIRGKAKKELDATFARRLGWAYAKFLNAPPGSFVAVGRDVRLSSPELFEGLTAGLREAGLSVYDIGIVPTPLLYFSLYELDVVGGIMITASHNPPEENGFKICRGKTTIASADIQKLYEIFTKAENPKKSGILIKMDVTTSYKKRMLEEFKELKEKPTLRVVVDAGNGAAGPVALSIFSELKLEIFPLYCEPDGSFPNHIPDPTVGKYMATCMQKVVEGGFDLGIGFDGDGDRLGVINEKGELLYGDRILILFSREVLRENPGARIVAEVKCTNYLFEDIKKRGGQPIIWKAGHSLIKLKMLEEKALLGGEMSGHFFFADRYYGYDDAIYAALRTLQIARRAKLQGLPFSALLSDMPPLFATEEIRLPVNEDYKGKLVEGLKEILKSLEIPGFKVQEVIDIDGVRINYDHGWGLLRSSNTQAVVVIRLESDSEEGLETLKRYFLGTVENRIRELG
jgi:phosphomannomutase/phosphoglucomutase